MADVDTREAFPVLQNASTKAGEALDRRQEGEAAASMNGLVGFSFKDQSGNVILPQLTSAGAVPVDMESLGDPLRSRGKQAGTTSFAEITDATVTLTIDKKYYKISCLVACRRDASLQLIQSDNSVETVLADMVVGPGQYSFEYIGGSDEILAGSTGAQKLLVKGKCFEAVSDISATITCLEKGATA